MISPACRKSTFVLILSCVAVLAAADSPAGETRTRQGLWISAIEEKNVLGDTKKIDQLIAFSEKFGFNTLFIQIYRADQAWFPSQTADAGPYRDQKSSAGRDSIEYLIAKAHERRIQVHAWINALSVAQNHDAPIILKYGQGVLTRDQFGELPFLGGKSHPRFGGFELENQLFLEPGDWRVKQHVTDIAKEIAGAYPGLDGLHLDYIRYPSAVPYAPGSRFNNVGLSYGYGEYNIRQFGKVGGFDPRRVSGQRSQARVWDQWKRDQVTDVLRRVVEAVREINPRIAVSCAVVPSLDRFYEGMFQDWPAWIEKGLADFVILMNYTADERRFRLISESATGLVKDPSKVMLGIGAYLLEKDPLTFKHEWESARSFRTGGTVIFSYTSVLDGPLKEQLEIKRTAS